MTGEAITVDTARLRQRVGSAVTDAVGTASQSVTDNLEAVRSWGIGGSWLESLINGIRDLFTRVSNWLSSLFGGSASAAPVTPAAPAASPSAPPATATQPEVAPPAPTPAVPAAPGTQTRGR